MAKVTVKEAGPGEAPGRKTVVDGLGRRITIKRPDPLTQMRMFKVVGPELSLNDRYLGFAVLAFSVTELDGDPVRNPANQSELEMLVQRLGEEGLSAAGEGLTSLAPGRSEAEVAAAAKNS